MIYGTGNRAGVTYAHYLADMGFNLILIERDAQPLNDLENDLKKKFSQQADNNKGSSPRKRTHFHVPQIFKVVLNKFD